MSLSPIFVNLQHSVVFQRLHPHENKKVAFFLFKDFSDQDEQRTKRTNEVGAWAF